MQKQKLGLKKFKEMKKQYYAVEYCIRYLGLKFTDFYDISFSDSHITMQGKYTEALNKKLCNEQEVVKTKEYVSAGSIFNVFELFEEPSRVRIVLTRDK